MCLGGALTEEGEEVHDAEPGDDVQVDLGHELALRRVRRALGGEVGRQLLVDRADALRVLAPGVLDDVRRRGLLLSPGETHCCVLLL